MPDPQYDLTPNLEEQKQLAEQIRSPHRNRQLLIHVLLTDLLVVALLPLLLLLLILNLSTTARAVLILVIITLIILRDLFLIYRHS